MRNKKNKGSFAFVTPRKIRLQKGRQLLGSRSDDAGSRRNSCRFQRVFSIPNLKLKSLEERKINREDNRKKGNKSRYPPVLEPNNWQVLHFQIDYMPLCCEEDLEMVSKFLSTD